MKRILLTGMSGTGKSTLIGELAARGHKTSMRTSPGGRTWAGRGLGVGRIQNLLSIEDADVLFLSGCAENQVGFYPQSTISFF